MRTRTTLINRLKNWQDQASWQAFFDTYWRLIYGVAVKSGLTGTEAQDVVQETMISVAKHMPNFQYDRNIGSFKAWLTAISEGGLFFRLSRTEAIISRVSGGLATGSLFFVSV